MNVSHFLLQDLAKPGVLLTMKKKNCHLTVLMSILTQCTLNVCKLKLKFKNYGGWKYFCQHTSPTELLLSLSLTALVFMRRFNVSNDREYDKER